MHTEVMCVTTSPSVSLLVWGQADLSPATYLATDDGGVVEWERCLWDFGSIAVAAAAAKSLQSCPTLCDPIDGSPPGSSVPGILQARTLEWVAVSFSSAWKWKVKVKLLSCVRLLVIPWTVVYQASLSMGFSRQEYWSGLPLPYHSINWSVHKLYEHKACSQCNTFCSLSSSWLLWVIHPYPSCSHKAFAMSLRLGSP